MTSRHCLPGCHGAAAGCSCRLRPGDDGEDDDAVVELARPLEEAADAVAAPAPPPTLLAAGAGAGAGAGVEAGAGAGSLVPVGGGAGAAGQVSSAAGVGALDVWAWVDAARSRWLTVADVRDLEPGDTLELVLLDRNLEDVVCSPRRGFPAGAAHHPAAFFAPQRAVYTHGGGGAGRMAWPAADAGEGGEGGRAARAWETAFEWEVEYAPGRWYPLEGGVLPAVDSQMAALFGVARPLLGVAVAWDDLRAGTPVGWRGPALRWADLLREDNEGRSLPPVCWGRDGDGT